MREKCRSFLILLNTTCLLGIGAVSVNQYVENGEEALGCSSGWRKERTGNPDRKVNSEGSLAFRGWGVKKRVT